MSRVSSGLGSADVADIVVLVASVEPSVVFASLAARCLRAWCDLCTIELADLTDGGEARYRISYPSIDAPRVLFRTAGTSIVRVPFTDQGTTTRGQHPGVDCCQAPFRGVAYFGWRQHQSTPHDRLTAALLVEHAVQTVAYQRAEEAARAQAASVSNLKIALRNSRHIGAAIGILMSLHMLTEDQAFDLLGLASQCAHRRLRDVALEVVATGQLDPAILDLTAKANHPAAALGASASRGRPPSTCDSDTPRHRRRTRQDRFAAECHPDPDSEPP